jgi:hydrogenase-4 membrane subunit HyfE
MFLLMARRNAIAMVLGYIMMENGIYLVGTTFSVRALHIVEFGILTGCAGRCHDHGRHPAEYQTDL